MRHRLTVTEERRRIEDGLRRLKEGENLAQIASAWGLSNKSVVHKFLTTRGVDTTIGQRVRQREAELDRKHKLRKVRKYGPKDKCSCGCGGPAKSRGMSLRCYINWYKREKRKGTV